MGKRPARCYRVIKNKPYPKSKYCKKCPRSKIRFFDIGNKSAHVDEYSSCYLTSLEPINISSQCVEALRITINRAISKKLKKKKYHLKIHIHPWHILRNNKMLAKAGADRVQTGMRLAFGKTVALCARVGKYKKILSIRSKRCHSEYIFNLIKKLSYKISGKQVPVILSSWGFTKFSKLDFLFLSQRLELYKKNTRASLLKSSFKLSYFIKNKS
uniref:Ribosomal protein L10e n=1 Tax=Lotharella vacuolata TaxID=74820 RepID=A0A0H5BGZ1_9EUKA|nr:ribosomal protein L10e [Lotharella vacuolata]